MLFQPAWSWSTGPRMHAAPSLPGLQLVALFSIIYAGIFSSMKNLSQGFKNLSLEIAASRAFYMSKV